MNFDEFIILLYYWPIVLSNWRHRAMSTSQSHLYSEVTIPRYTPPLIKKYKLL